MRSAKVTSWGKRGLIALAVLVLSGTSAGRAAAQSAEERLREVLASPASVADKCNACRELQATGTEMSVPALEALLTDPAISHTARMALEVMPYPAAGAALRAAAGKTSGLTRSGIIDSLGERRDTEAVPLLAAALTDSDAQVRAAAATALGKIGTADAAEALAAAHAKAAADDRTACGLALVRCADRLCQADQRDKAATFYANLSQPGEDRVVRLAAHRGRLQSAGPEAAAVVAQALAGEDLLVRQAAAEQLPNLSSRALGEVAAKMADLPATGQIAVLAAIRIRQERPLAAVALQAAGAGDPAVQVAAIQALGSVGGASPPAFPLLNELSAQEGPSDWRPGKASNACAILRSMNKLPRGFAPITILCDEPPGSGWSRPGGRLGRWRCCCRRPPILTGGPQPRDGRLDQPGGAEGPGSDDLCGVTCRSGRRARQRRKIGDARLPADSRPRTTSRAGPRRRAASQLPGSGRPAAAAGTHRRHPGTTRNPVRAEFERCEFVRSGRASDLQLAGRLGVRATAGTLGEGPRGDSSSVGLAGLHPRDRLAQRHSGRREAGPAPAGDAASRPRRRTQPGPATGFGRADHRGGAVPAAPPGPAARWRKRPERRSRN